MTEKTDKQWGKELASMVHDFLMECVETNVPPNEFIKLGAKKVESMGVPYKYLAEAFMEESIKAVRDIVAKKALTDMLGDSVGVMSPVEAMDKLVESVQTVVKKEHNNNLRNGLDNQKN